MVHGHAKAQLLDIETKASFLIADEDDHGMKAEVRIAAVEPQQRSFNEGELVRGHWEDYTGVSECPWSLSDRSLPRRERILSGRHLIDGEPLRVKHGVSGNQ